MGRDDSAADVVIVGERRVPVAVMRQPNPWLAVDDDEEDDEGNKGRRGARTIRRSADGRPSRTNRGRRRGSFDESEDPATAMSVVSEQLWGLQQKLIGTYMAVARARLGRGFPDLSSSAYVTNGYVAEEQGRHSGSSFGSPGIRAPHEGKKVAGGKDEGETEDGPGEETRAELVAGTIDSLCAAWDHLTEAMVTLDRRAAGALACEEAARVGGLANQNYPVDVDQNRRNAGKAASTINRAAQPSECEQHECAQEEQAEDLGPLWAGSLSEALARSGDDSEADDDVGNTRGSFRIHGGTADCVDGAGVSEEVLDSSLKSEKINTTGNPAWDRAASRQLGARRAELFELCGDIAHACFSMRSAATAAVTNRSRSPDKDLLEGLLPRLEALLSSARPPVELADLDVCRSLHGHVWEALLGSTKNCDKRIVDGGKPSVSGMSKGVSSHRNAFDGGSAMRLCCDPAPLVGTCVHSLAGKGQIPGDSVAWSLCLAAEACYEQAVLDLPYGGGSRQAERGRVLPPGFDAEALIAKAAIEARARLRRKLGNASNELGKLMSQCAGVLVQAPAPLLPQQTVRTRLSPTASSSVSTSTTNPSGAGHTEVHPQPQHPGLACAVCVACAEARFRQGLDQFKGVDDERNTALLLCNLASVERLRPRALARLQEACPAVLSQGMPEGGGGSGGARMAAGRHAGSKLLPGQ